MIKRRPRGLGSASVIVAGALLAAAAATGGAFAAGGNDGSGNGSSSVSSGGSPSRATVTLITGDAVAVDTFPDGAQAVVPEPGPGRTGVSFVRWTRNGSVTVVPSDALGLLDRGVLDPALFDVTELIRQGYDDRGMPALPLIVRYDDAPAARTTTAPEARAAVGRTATVGLELPSIQGQAVSERKADAGEFWRAVTAPAPGARLAPGTAPEGLAPGIAHIWLDGRVHASLDQSVPHIGAPEAWGGGWTGAGVRTAVLDTGIDPAHPDLADAVVAKADFTATPNGAVDTNGHGTHVASIITSNGGASQGRYAGVAPDAQLLIGRVLDDEAVGWKSRLIAGMEWAVAQQARVVNISLGAAPTDGTDPMSLAVDALSASSGALFVIAAGNDGAPGTINTPAAATSALTVGAVNPDDALADFSSRGPRVGDHAVKPEITAPGVGIVAARAAGTGAGEPVDGNYTAMSGTSMAAPHVAGAAAVLAQRHPDWRGAQLKDALVGSASPSPLTVYEQGTGRVDVAAAVERTVSASPSTLSTYLRPADTGPVTRTVTYRNDGDDAVVLDLSLTADPGAPLRLDTARVTVPPHATADAALTIDPAASETGTYGGVVDARGADGTWLVRTALGVYDAPESYDLHIAATDRDGAVPDGVALHVINIGTGEWRQVWRSGDGFTASVPPGRYSVVAMIPTPATVNRPESWTLVTRDVQVTADTTVTADARTGLPAGLALDRGGTNVAYRSMGIAQRIAGQQAGIEVYLPAPEMGAYAVPTTVDGRPFTFRLTSFLTTGDGREHYNLAAGHDAAIPPDPTLPVRTADLAAVDARVYAQAGPLTANITRLAGWGDEFGWGGWSHDVAVPGTAREYFTAQPGLTWLSFLENAGALTESGPEVAYPARRVTTEDWNKAVSTSQATLLRCGNELIGTTAAFNPPTAGHTAAWNGGTARVTLSRDGKEVAVSEDAAYVSLPGLAPEKATYTLRLAATRDDPTWQLGTTTDATWTFPSEHPTEECAATPIPLPTVRAEAQFDLDNRAPSGRPFTLTLRVERPDGTPTKPRAVATELSYNNGTTWYPVPVLPTPHGYVVVTPPPPPNGDGYVALRTKVRDAEGISLTQTTLRAYRVG